MNKSLVYNENVKILDVAVSALNRTGLEKYLNNYKVVSYGSSGADEPHVISMVKDFPDIKLNKINSKNMLRSPEFEEVLGKYNLRDHKIITYKPVCTAKLKTYNQNTAETQLFENKAWIRENFANELPFPKFCIFDKDEIPTYSELIKELNEGFILQHERFSGGKGTFFIHSQVQLHEAINLLSQKDNSNFKVVTSRKIDNPTERSIQACVTKNNGILTGPIQAQFVRIPELAPLKNSDQFCGGTISAKYYESPYARSMFEILDRVGQLLSDKGYRGLFGIDFIISQDQLYLLEVNARTTGMLPLLNYLELSPPLHLINLLEITGTKYELIAEKKNDTLAANGSYFIIHYDNPDRAIIASTYRNEKIALGELNITYKTLVQKGDVLVPGGRIGIIFVDSYIEIPSSKYSQLLPFIEKVKKCLKTESLE